MVDNVNGNGHTIDEDENEAQQNALDDLNALTVLQDVGTPNLGDARLNVVRSTDTGDGGLGNLATIHTGTNTTVDRHQTGFTQTGVGVVIDNTIPSSPIPEIETVTNETTPAFGREPSRGSVTSLDRTQGQVDLSAPVEVTPVNVTRQTEIPVDAPIASITNPTSNNAVFQQADTQVAQAGEVVQSVDNNTAPVAQEITFTTNEDGTLTFTDADILKMVSDPDGDALSLVSIDNVEHGVLTRHGDGTWTFAPDANWNGELTFNYTVSDGHGHVATSSINIEVESVNDAPTVDGSLNFTGTEDTSFLFTKEALLANAHDIDGDNLSVLNVTSNNGTITDNGDGTYTFTPNANFHGDVDISYQVTDGNATVNASAVLDIESVNDAPEVISATDALELTTDLHAQNSVVNSVSGQIVVADADGDGLTYTVVPQGDVHGTFEINNDGTFTYTSTDTSFGGMDKFTIRVEDGNGGFSEQTISIDVTGHIAVPADVIYKTVTETYTVQETHTETYTVQEPRTETYTEMETRTETVIVQEPRTETYTVMEEQTITVPDYETRTETVIVQEPRTETYTVMETRTETYTTTEQQTVTVPREYNYEGDGRNANNVEVKTLEEALTVDNGTNHENGTLVFKNINQSSFELGNTNDTFIVQQNCHESKIDLGGGDNVLVFECNPGKDVEVSGGTGNDVLVLPGKLSDYHLGNLEFEHGAFHGTITGPANMSLEIRDFDTIKFSDGFKGDESLIMETRVVDVEVEHTREVEVPVEHTREIMVDVEQTHEVQVQVGEHTETVQVPVEYTREVMVDVEQTHEVQVPVEHTREVMVDVEYTRDVTVDVEHTRDVQVIDEDAMTASGAYQDVNGDWVVDQTVETNHTYMDSTFDGHATLDDAPQMDTLPQDNIVPAFDDMVDNERFIFQDNGGAVDSWTAVVDPNADDAFNAPMIDTNGWTDLPDHTQGGDMNGGDLNHNDVQLTPHDDHAIAVFDYVDRSSF